MLPGTTIFLCLGAGRWAKIARWSPNVARAIMHRAHRLDTGREIWRWVVDVKPKHPTEGCMREVDRGT